MAARIYSTPKTILWRRTRLAVKRKFECLDDDGDDPQDFVENSPAFQHEAFAMQDKSFESSDSFHDDDDDGDGTNEPKTVNIHENESIHESYEDDSHGNINSDHYINLPYDAHSELDIQIAHNSEAETDCSTDSSSLDTNCEQEACLGNDLADWAVRFPTNQVALSSLLKILRKSGHPDLPSDAETLLKTDFTYASKIRKIASGSYHHCGVEKNGIAPSKPQTLPSFRRESSQFLTSPPSTPPPALRSPVDPCTPVTSVRSPLSGKFDQDIETK